MTKKIKSMSMTTILIIIAVIALVYVGAWARAGFIAGVIDLGCKKTYSPKYGLPFVWMVTIIPDPKLPKLSSDCTASRYEVNIFTSSLKSISSAPTVKKICSKSSYEIDIIEYSDSTGKVGGYLESMTQSIENITNIKDAPAVLYDKDGNRIGLDSFFNTEKQREDFTNKFSELKKNFPNEKTFSCPKK